MRDKLLVGTEKNLDNIQIRFNTINEIADKIKSVERQAKENYVIPNY